MVKNVSSSIIRGINSRRKNRGAKIFCVVMLIYPLAQWLVFYVYANINSVLLAFLQYNIATGKFAFYPAAAIFTNFESVLADLFGSGSAVPLGRYLLNGALFHLGGLLIAYPVSLMFAFIVCKKLPLSGTIKTLLFLPSILSTMIVAMIFKYFAEFALPSWTEAFGLKNSALPFDQKRAFGTLFFFNVFFAMPGQIVINVSTMSRVPEDLIEYGKLEGLSMFGEFVHLTLPLIYPLLEVQLLGCFVGFFTFQGPLYALFAENAKTQVGDGAITFGYYMYVRVVGRNASELYYGYTSAANVLIGIVSVPIVFCTKKLLDRFDPDVTF